VNWLQFGDRNTKYFHNACSARRRRNRIGDMRREDGVWVVEEEEKKEHISNYFSQLFRSNTSMNEQRMQQLLDAVKLGVMAEMNAGLVAEFTNEEIKAAVEAIGDLKAPGPDGMPTLFFKQYWDVVGEQLTREVQQVLRGGRMHEGWNDTIISLIPKVDKPQKVTELRPISLCNVVYKVISKVLANRLRAVLPELITPNQSAFVLGRLISDNILIAYEVTHYLLNKREGKTGFAAIKLDMSKAYDRVEWIFLEKMMRQMGFAEQWIALIMECVSTVKYRVKVNGDMTDSFVPGRGLRQGDPLSPYLFLLCAEAFSALLRKGEEDGLLAGVRICHNAPSISHLLFADDSLIMIRANEGDCAHLQEVLQLYEDCSGQMINKAKSAILFSKNTSPANKRKVCDLLQVTKETMSEKYLGLPVHVGRSKVNTFAYLKDRVWKRMQGWNERFLSWARKEILIKAVAQAIPTFAMGCFDLTKSLCDQIGAMICRFWWNQHEGQHKIHWLGKEQLLKPKEEGGLGFRDIHSFNMAMLAKQGWRLLKEPESLCARVLKAKYHPNGSVLDAQPRRGMSYSWRSILLGLEVVKKGMIWRVGDGAGIHIWSDPWLPRDESRKPLTPRGHSLVESVDELIDPHTGTWDEQLVSDLFWEEDAAVILALPIHQGRENFISWHFEKLGIFSVKSAYRVARKMVINSNTANGQQVSTSRGVDSVWKSIWRLKCPNKLKHFLWRFGHNSHPLRINLVRRGMTIPTRCPVCNQSEEDGGHLFFKCKAAKQLWRAIGLESGRPWQKNRWLLIRWNLSCHPLNKRSS